MTIWTHCKMSTLYYSEDGAEENYPCVVKIIDDEILVEYDDEGLVKYRGPNDASGHFLLAAPDVEGRASLHRFPDADILEGSWVEAGYRGMWRIGLA